MPLRPVTEQRLHHIRTRLPLHVRHQADFIVHQMKPGHLPKHMRYMPLRQLPSRFPTMTEEQHAVLAFYILGEAGYLEALDSTHDKLDSLSAMGEMESLRLQLAMDRLSTFMKILSNILKLMNDTSSAIVQNIK